MLDIVKEFNLLFQVVLLINNCRYNNFVTVLYFQVFDLSLLLIELNL